MQPGAFKHRNNTNNTIFGFEQVLDDDDNHRFVNQPDGAGVNRPINEGQYDPQKDNVNIYQYATPGNLGNLVYGKNKQSNLNG